MAGNGSPKLVSAHDCLLYPSTLFLPNTTPQLDRDFSAGDAPTGVASSAAASGTPSAMCHRHPRQPTPRRTGQTATARAAMCTLCCVNLQSGASQPAGTPSQPCNRYGERERGRLSRSCRKPVENLSSQFLPTDRVESKQKRKERLEKSASSNKSASD